MTWRWVTFFSLTVVCGAATVSGRVEVTGSKDPSGVVVWLEPTGGVARPTPPRTVTVAHTHKTFVPHVTAIRTGSKVRFPNLDPFFHNAFSNYDGQTFDVGLHPPGSFREVAFRRVGVVRVFCNIHPTMSAVVAVLDTPWFAVSDEHGAFRINGLAPGEYRLKVFQESAEPEALGKLERNVVVGTEEVIVSGLEVSETGFVTPPHKNKFGEDYPPIIVDQYPGNKR